MRTIAVVNQKGGCGKTTVSINLAGAFAEIGKKTLLVDMDPQSHCAVGLAVPEEQIEQSIYDVLISKSRGEPIKLSEILWQINERFDLAPASIDLSAFEQQMTGVADRELCLKKVLDELKDIFDFVIIDCPPAVGILTFNALHAATEVIVPVETGYFSLHGLSRLLETLNILCEKSGRKIKVRVLASMYDIRTKMAREIMAELRSCFGDKMFRTIVNFNTKIKEAASFGQPVLEYDPASKGKNDFLALAEEVINSQTLQQRKELVNSLSAQLDSISASADELLRSAKQTITVEKLVVPIAVAAVSKSLSGPAITTSAQTNENQLSQASSLAVAVTAKRSDPTPVSGSTEPPLHLPVGRQEQGSASGQSKDNKTTAGDSKRLDEKLSDYYGVSQTQDAIVFVTLYPRAAKVQIAGDFNNWQPEKTQMAKVGESGVWQAKLKLPPGKHQYRFVVDGQWQQDPYNEKTELNPFGGFNSVVDVK